MKWMGMLATLIATTIIYAQSSEQDIPGYAALTIDVQGFKSNQGVLRVALVNSEAMYKTRNEAFRGQVLDVHDQRVFCTFDSLPAGEYAVKLYHDKNNNDRLDANFLGMPKEAYGFSNDARGKFGLPDYEKARFTITTPGDTITVHIK